MSFFTTDNLTRLRMETPGAKNRIHLNNAGAALMPLPVISAIQEHLQRELEMGGYEAAADQQQAIDGFYTALARLLGAKAHQIAFAANATDAYNRALSSIPFQAGDTILTTANDYVSNQIAFLQARKRFGVKVLRAADLPSGGVDPDSMRELARRHRPKLVAVTHVPTNSGLVQPVADIGAICRENDVLYLVDACQSVGQLALDVEALQCDFLSATFRKFLRGPRGAGFLYVSDRALEAGLEPLYLDLHSAEWTAPDEYKSMPSARRFELWERPHALVLGAKAAVEYALSIGPEEIEARVKMLAGQCRRQARAIDGLRVLDTGLEQSGIVTLHLPGWDPQTLKSRLQSQQINTSITDLASARIDFDEKGVTWALRISPHYYNTEEEIETALSALKKMVL